MTPAAPGIMRAAGGSFIGKRSKNEDAFLIREIGETMLLAVADGVGGHCGGEVASALATRTLLDEVSAALSDGSDGRCMEGYLAVAFARAHEVIAREARGPLAGMGTTLVAALIRDHEAIVANTGDSRAYLIGDTVSFRTRDHSLRQAVMDGQAPGQWARYPLRGVLTRSLGHHFEVDTYLLPLSPGETVLLCTDGFHDVVPEERMLGCLGAGDPEADVGCLIGEAVPTATDNVTVVVYRVP